MISNHLLLPLYGISICFIVTTVSREAIIGGIPVSSVSSLPYQVSVIIDGLGLVCGGGIIADRFILTAAHCVLNRTRHLRSDHIFIFAGTINLNSTGPPAVIGRVQQVFFPKAFHPMVEFAHGDIAVLKLANALQLERQHGLGKLELPENEHSHVTSATIAGFGWQIYNSTTGHGHSNGHLQRLWAFILPDHDCEEKYPNGAIQTDKHLCASDQPYPTLSERSSHGVCIGDSGGPLVQDGKIIIGVLSRIPPHCNERQPGLYTRVSHYALMIHNVMEHGHNADMISLNT